jgi:hypothetical protein
MLNGSEAATAQNTEGRSLDAAAGSLPSHVHNPEHRFIHRPVLSYSSSLIIEEGEPGIEPIRPLRVGNADMRAHVEYFKRQLETIETVDEAIDEIDAGYYHERRDA